MTKRIPYDMNKVTALEPQENGKNLGGEKETVAVYKFIAPNPRNYGGRYTDAITVKVYMARSASASTVYASVWARSRDGETHLSGHGKAGGYGYHKESAAIQEAMQSAGVTFKGNFGGSGDKATEIAIAALAKKLGWKTGQVMGW